MKNKCIYFSQSAKFQTKRRTHQSKLKWAKNGKKDEGWWRVMKGWILPFIPKSLMFIGIPGEKMKGWRVKSHSDFKESSYKNFSKICHIYFYRNTATINFYHKELRKQNAKQIFLFRQVCKAPKEGHYWAKARAPSCSGKSTFVPPKSAMVHKSDTTPKSGAQISIFQRYESQTSHLHFKNNRIKCFIYLSLCFISKETLILRRFFTINNLKTVGVFKLKLYFCRQKISIYMETSL